VTLTAYTHRRGPLGRLCVRVLPQAGGSLGRFEPADNMDLSTVMMDFEDAFEAKHGRPPKLFRRSTDGGAGGSMSAPSQCVMHVIEHG
jgi:hypothetical protein